MEKRKATGRYRVSGTKLRALREFHGITQFELAYRARTAQSYISQLERDVDRNISLEVLNALTESLEVGLMDILVDNEPHSYSVMAGIDAAVEALRNTRLTQRELAVIAIKLQALVDTRGQWPLDEA